MTLKNLACSPIFYPLWRCSILSIVLEWRLLFFVLPPRRAQTLNAFQHCSNGGNKPQPVVHWHLVFERPCSYGLNGIVAAIPHCLHDFYFVGGQSHPHSLCASSLGKQSYEVRSL